MRMLIRSSVHNFSLVAAWRFLKELRAEVDYDRVGLVAAGIAFYGLLSLFPGIAAMMALGGLLTEPTALVELMRDIGGSLPPEAQKIIIDQAVSIAGSQNGGLGLAALVGIALSLYSASKAVGALIAGIHVAAGERDDRGFLASTLFTLAMTAMLTGFALVAVFSTIIVPTLIAAFNLSEAQAWIAGLVRWPLMWIMAALAIGALYRLSFRNRNPRCRWITPGAMLSATLWLAGSVAFSIYVQNFANYNETFGTLGGVVSLLMWMWLSSYIILLGEEVNALISKSYNDKPHTVPDGAIPVPAS